MTTETNLTKPWLVAVWPGMGHVAVSAGYYLMAKLGMHLLAELSANEFFDIEHVEIKNGIVQKGRMPQSRFWVWKDPRGRRDLVVVRDVVLLLAAVVVAVNFVVDLLYALVDPRLRHSR